MLMRGLVLLFPALIIGGITSAIMTMLLNAVPNNLRTFTSLLVAALLLAFSLVLNPRKEDFIADLPIVLIISAFASLIGVFLAAVSFKLEFTPIGIVTVFSSVYFAEALLANIRLLPKRLRL